MPCSDKQGPGSQGPDKKAFVIAGTGSGCGKTTVALGILRALMQRGLAVQPFKIGPDYLDSGWHSAVCGVTSRNLDAFMLPAATLNGLYKQHLRHADVAVIEGVMGLYDGYGTDPDYCSSAAMAKQLGCPVILLVDGKAVSTSVAASVMGFCRFDPALNIAGVIVNRVNSPGHYELLRHAIERYCAIPVLGRLPAMEDAALPSRHLGLIPAREQTHNDLRWQRLARQVEQTIELDRLLALCAITTLPAGEPPALPDAALADGLTLALADDEAFNFYYQDNLDLLEQAGVRLRRFSPLHDRQLPDCQMIYIGGGYPEIHAARLAANTSMHAALRDAHRRRIPLYAECGGLMYLGDELIDADGRRHAMAGILPGVSRMGKRLTRFGYCEAQAGRDTLLAARGEVLRGHEFHYSDFSTALPPAFDCAKWRDGAVVQRWQGGYQLDQTCASYLHLHFAQRPGLLNRWLRCARSLL
ncbi:MULTISPECIES: cobyrinate a,c-diamide synthase [Brenneria]|uniref:Cobyrinate a,c-diamide synthase n=1 Tax=Brenneria nigrifluens DSM 30175 = ATCC 13028 TaxID=1121120 RepID=A0A2U1UX57_9GAMM|nr:MULTISPECIES: cobyrinate a,c-diamide synthase [Brenneria]EHD22393.1 Cobyrinic acid A,C-diamide synthase [Brenneria sp. EniD312]PWC26266.1 cobyrinate a,c-diamide synthase [Brenneria nigrifluens DSM 30175 = ATCC 13028]QCR05399.1 cobyrinate a,c-diamide synthase [Brenneria nigrifluens DSM 30175 = ATCC 13028]